MKVCFHNFIFAAFYPGGLHEKTVSCIYFFFPCNNTAGQHGAYDEFAVKINETLLGGGCVGFPINLLSCLKLCNEIWKELQERVFFSWMG